MELYKKYCCVVLGLFYFCFNQQLIAQSTYLINYNFIPQNVSYPTINNREVFYQKEYIKQLLFNDTLSFNCFLEKDKNIFAEFEKLGKKRTLVHNTLTLFNQDNLFEISCWPIVKKDYLVFDTLKNYNWVIDSSEKYFLDFHCKEAFSLINTTDTLFILYTTELQQPFGPTYHHNSPGVVLEAYDQYMQQYFIATKIEKVDYNMKLPSDKILLSRKDYLKRK